MKWVVRESHASINSDRRNIFSPISLPIAGTRHGATETRVTATYDWKRAFSEITTASRGNKNGYSTRIWRLVRKIRKNSLEAQVSIESDEIKKYIMGYCSTLNMRIEPEKYMYNRGEKIIIFRAR